MAPSKAEALTNAPEVNINLIVRKSAQRDERECNLKCASAHRYDTVSIDITEQVLNSVESFGWDSIVGMKYNVDIDGQKCYKHEKGLYTRDDLWHLYDEITTVLDAAIVNQKQKEALAMLIAKATNKVIDDRENHIQQSPCDITLEEDFS